MTSPSEFALDDLELELRKMAGVRAAGFETRDELLIIQLQVVPSAAEEGSLPVAATRIAARYADRPVAVEIIRWREPSPSVETPAATAPDEPAASSESGAVVSEPATDEKSAGRRVRLLAVLSFPDTDELEVHLILDGRRTIGRAGTSRGLLGAVDATLEAVREFGFPFSPQPRWARAVESAGEEALIAVALDESDAGEHVLYGVAAGTTPLDAAARATLDALNRRLAR